MKRLIAPFVAGALLAGGLGVALAQSTQTAPSATEKKAEKAADKTDKMTMATQTAVGRVKSVSADSLVVMGKSKGKGAEWTFVLDAKTKIKRAGKDTTAADLKEGDGVQVRYMEHGGKNVAQTVMARGELPKHSEAKPADKKQ